MDQSPDTARSRPATLDAERLRAEVIAAYGRIARRRSASPPAARTLPLADGVPPRPGGGIQRLESFVVRHPTCRVCRAESEDPSHAHARPSGSLVDRIGAVKTVVDPSLAAA